MTKRRESEQQWEQIVSLVERCRRSVAMSLSEAQQRFDAAPELVLSPLFVRSVVSQALHGRTERLQSTMRRWLGELVFSADALAWVEAGWMETPRVVGVERDRLWIGVATVVRSDDVDAGRLAGLRPGGVSAASAASTDPVVYDAWADWRGLGHSEFRRVRQGTVLSDAYLDGRALSVQEFGTQHALWCDSADHRWESRARIRDN
jgi:hypothetical protein